MKLDIRRRCPRLSPSAHLPSSPPSHSLVYEVFPRNLRRDGGSVVFFGHSADISPMVSKSPRRNGHQIPSFYPDGTHNAPPPPSAHLGREKKGRRPGTLLKQGHLLLGSWENVSETRAPLEPSFPPQLDSDNCISQSGHKGALPPLYFKYT